MFSIERREETLRVRKMQERHGRVLGLGTAQDAVMACLREKEAAGTCSHGYRLAAFDISHRIHMLLLEAAGDSALAKITAAADASEQGHTARGED